MSEHPILFNGPMVKAILDGRKTQTRRVVKLPHNNPLGTWEPTAFSGRDAHGREHAEQVAIWHTRTGDSLACPLGIPGDRLWVRETWRPTVVHGCAMNVCDCGDVEVRYSADGGSKFFRDEDIPQDWTMPAAAARGFVPSIHMPRWACRLVLEITEVRVQRLQDISEADACAEGLGSPITRDCKVPKFADLWRAVYGPTAWSVNPWVWAVSFRRAG